MGKKKPPSLAVLNLLGSRRCYVNLPLLHRLWVGIAKVKEAGKENCVAHDVVHKKVRTTITTIPANWQAILPPIFSAGTARAAQRLRASDTAAGRASLCRSRLT
jgi:hypothetical protein